MAIPNRTDHFLKTHIVQYGTNDYIFDRKVYKTPIKGVHGYIWDR